MRVQAIAKKVRISPLKARLVADLVRGKHVAAALDILQFTPNKAALIVRKVLESAIANAENNEAADVDELRIAEIYVNKGLVMKRMMPRAKGRGDRIQKPTCHITVAVADGQD